MSFYIYDIPENNERESEPRDYYEAFRVECRDKSEAELKAEIELLSGRVFRAIEFASNDDEPSSDRAYLIDRTRLLFAAAEALEEVRTEHVPY